jgi:putative transposase
MVTGSTLYKEHYFRNPEDLDFLQNLLFELAEKYHWLLEAWSLFSNHYHLIVQSPKDPTTLKKFITHLHGSSARSINNKQQAVGRKVWYEYWDTQLTYENSYLARLNYVMKNPEKHGLVAKAWDYKWCSARWFIDNTPKARIKTIEGFKIDSVNVYDDF